MTDNIDEIIDFYKSASQEELIAEANKVCEQHYGNKVYLRGLIEFSNECALDCLYCGIRKSHSEVNRYHLSKEQILQAVKNGYDVGLRTFVLQSGEGNFYSTQEMCSIIEQIKSITHNEAAVTLSMGMRSKQDYKDFKSSGADRYLMRFETSDPEIYKYLRNGASLQKRLDALIDLRGLGYEVGSGYMIGLPGETEQIRINNALLCRELDLHMVGIGPFLAHPQTPLKDETSLTIDEVVKATALLRLLLPRANIPASTATGTLDPLGREKVLAAGANVVMPNISPVSVKKDYLLYPDKICIDESGLECVSCLRIRFHSVGKISSYERGNSLHQLRKNVI